MLNAWELLLKARIIKENDNDITSIFMRAKANAKSGETGKGEDIEKDSLNIEKTIGIDKAINIVRQYSEQRIDKYCVQNLNLLRKIRNSSIHLHNMDENLGGKIQMVAAATLKNFVLATETWFNADFSKFKLHLMPLSFQPHNSAVEVVQYSERQDAAGKLINAIAQLEKDNTLTGESQYCVIAPVYISYKQENNKSATSVRIDANDPNATPVKMSDDNFQELYPLTYKKLTSKLKKRYTDFVENQCYHDRRKALEENESCCYVRFLDPNRKTLHQKHYSFEIIKQFDTFYTLRTKTE